MGGKERERESTLSLATQVSKLFLLFYGEH